MIKKIEKLLSYVLVAALASVVTFAVTWNESPTIAKLAQLESMIEEKFIGESDTVQMADAAAAAMVDSLGDRWSYYMSEAEYEAHKEQMANAYVGIGVTISVLEDGSGVEILQVTPGAPAEEAGLLPGDVIIGVEGESVAGWDSSVIRERVKGKEGTFVKLTVLRQDKEMEFSVERRTVTTPVATGVMLKKNVGMVTIVNFDSRCAQETIAAIEDLLEQGADSLIFDVRSNPGGYATELVEVLDYLLPEGELFRTVDFAGREDVDMSDADCLEGIPMAVLVNGDSYSAAEFFAAALREYDAAVIVGERTVGKGYFQRTYPMVDGSAVGLSVGKYFTPKGVSLADAGGIVPDVEIPVTEDEAFMIYAGLMDPMEDPQILGAMEALGK